MMLLGSVVGTLTVSILIGEQKQVTLSKKKERTIFSQENRRSDAPVKENGRNRLTLRFTVRFNKACF